jgi:hypothetical protein
MPRVAVQFSEPSAAPLPDPDRRPSAPRVPESTARLQAALEKQLGGRAAYEQFANQIMETVDGLMARAHALRRLSERFQPEVESQLSAGDRQVLRELRREHSAALAALAAALEEANRPALLALGAAAPAPPPAVPAQPWQPTAEAVFREARRAEVLLAVMLGGTVDQTPPPDLPAQLLSALTRLRSAAQSQARGVLE